VGASVGAVTGTVERPARLVLGLCSDDDELHVVGGTAASSTVQQRALASLLVAAGDEHPWSTTVGGGHGSDWGGKDIDIVRFEPRVVVEEADRPTPPRLR
jgi:hypothetical protein